MSQQTYGITMQEISVFLYFISLTTATYFIMKKIYYSAIFFCLLFSACTSDEPVFNELTTPAEPLPPSVIDRTIRTTLEKQGEFSWRDVSTNVLWSALLRSDSVLAIGYQPANEANIAQKLHEIALSNPEWWHAKTTLLTELRAIEEQAADFPALLSKWIIHDDPTLPYVEVKITSYAALSFLRQNLSVRYAEPVSYTLHANEETVNQRTTSKLSCGYENDQDVPSADYVPIAPQAVAPWTFTPMRIAQAWQYSTGAGITVGLIDTGITPDQAKLGDQFNDGFSQGRTITKLGSYEGDGPDDRCGHGTRMAGAIVAPRGTTGTAVGVAYNANLVSYRGTSDVIVNSGAEKRGVASALVDLGDRSEVRIISMSIGDVFNSGTVADGIRYAYGKGKLIVCAAGTSTSFTNWAGVVFPARMDETVAVTGIKEGAGYKRCSNCHSGSKVDFTMVMQRADEDRTSLTLSDSGDGLAYVGGSSVATAMTAGVAALVWSQNPSWDRETVLQRLKESADLYPNRDRSFGWGTLDAYEAVGGSEAVAQN